MKKLMYVLLHVNAGRSRIIMCYPETWHIASISSWGVLCVKVWVRPHFPERDFISCSKTLLFLSGCKTLCQSVKPKNELFGLWHTVSANRRIWSVSTACVFVFMIQDCEQNVLGRCTVFEKCGLTLCVDGRARWRDVNKQMYWKSFTSDSLIL